MTPRRRFGSQGASLRAKLPSFTLLSEELLESAAEATVWIELKFNRAAAGKYNYPLRCFNRAVPYANRVRLANNYDLKSLLAPPLAERKSELRTVLPMAKSACHTESVVLLRMWLSASIRPICSGCARRVVKLYGGRTILPLQEPNGERLLWQTSEPSVE